MRITSLFAFLVVVVVLPITPAYAVGHHSHAPTTAHADASEKGHGPQGTAVIPHTPRAHWSAPAAERKRANPIAMSREGLLEAGELYRENCTACHGAEGQGDGPLAKDLEHEPANLFAMAPHHSDGDLRWKIAKGRGEMPGWEDVFTDEQIWMLVYFMKSLPAYHFAKRSDEQ